MDTSYFSDINWLAVLVAAVAYFALGGLWYAPLFGKQWIRYHNVDMNDPDAKKGVAGIMITTFVLILLICFGLALLIERMQMTEAISGFRLGARTGLLFSALAISITYLYLKKPLALHLIDGLYHVVGQIIAAIIICIWQ